MAAAQHGAQPARGGAQDLTPRRHAGIHWAVHAPTV
jgi:hypothetical protein